MSACGQTYLGKGYRQTPGTVSPLKCTKPKGHAGKHGRARRKRK